MAQLNMRIDDNLKRRAERRLKGMGLTPSAAVTLFFTQVVRKNCIPFVIEGSASYNDFSRRDKVAETETDDNPYKDDPFFQEPNVSHLRRAIADMEAGRNIVEHDIIPLPDEEDEEEDMREAVNA